MGIAFNSSGEITGRKVLCHNNNNNNNNNSNNNNFVKKKTYNLNKSYAGYKTYRVTGNISRFNVLLTTHHNISVQQDQQDTLFAFSLLRLIASTCFEYLFAHHQEALCTQQLVYFVSIMSVGW
jgi:hypothetical protein